MSGSAAALTEAQARLLVFCARYPSLHLMESLRSIRLLREGDADQAGALIERGYLVRPESSLDAVMVTPVGMVQAEGEGLSCPEADLGKFISMVFFDGNADK